MEKKSFFKSKLYWVVIGALILFILVVVSQKDKNDNNIKESTGVSTQADVQVQNQQIISVTAKKLYADYNANEVAADEVYKGKEIELTGQVESINKNFMDEVYIAIRTGSFNSIHCKVPNKNEAMSLKKGQTIKVIGVGGTMILGSPVLENCSIFQ